MHGRVKVRTSEEQAEAKKKEQQEKLKIYTSVTSKVFSKRSKQEYDEEALMLTQSILMKNSDFYTFWNYRREILQVFCSQKSEEESKHFLSAELSLTEDCLRTNPKSYSTWHHRLWLMELKPEADWKRELKLCNYFLSKDERNFHCWDYRRIVAKMCGVTAEEELEYTTQLIEANFSNYSAWHYRSVLLPLVHGDPCSGALKEDVLLKEFEHVQNAAFTDPNDQSVWFYHRWLLGKKKKPLHIMMLRILASEKSVTVLLSDTVKSREQMLKLKVDGTCVEVVWRPVNVHTLMSSVWVCDLPQNLEVNKCTISVGLLDQEESVLSCSVNGMKSVVWKDESRNEIFRPDFSSTAKNVLLKELESCQQLNELEPDCKWTLFTCILLMRALNDPCYQEEINNLLQKLENVDSGRKNYYKDLMTKFTVGDTIEQLPLDATEVDLSRKHLTFLYHFDHFLLIEKIDLSANNLTSVHSLGYLVCVKCIILDDNQVESLEGLEELQNLEELSVKRNCITRCDSLLALKSCRRLQKLFVEGNPVCGSNFEDTYKLLQSVQIVNSSPL